MIMIENAPVLTIEGFGFCGYDYRVDFKDGETFGYLNCDGQDNWKFSFGSNPSAAANSDPVSYDGYTINELKDELEFELTNFYIRFGINDCKYLL